MAHFLEILFPELEPLPAKPGGQWRDFQRAHKRLKRDALEERRAEHRRIVDEDIRRLAKQKAKAEDEFYLSDEEDYFANMQLRAKVSGSKATGLLELPPEVLSTIVEYCSAPEWKCLRLVHSYLAELRLLKQKLFEKFTLTPDPAKLFMIRRMADSIGPFVSTIYMRPIMIGAAENPNNHTSSFVKKNLKPAIDLALKNGSVLSAWIGFLSKTRPGVGIVFQYREKEGSWTTTCPGPPPEPMLRLSIASLAKSGCKVGRLEIEFYSIGANLCKNVSHWGELHLDELKELNVMFCLRSQVLDNRKHVDNFSREHTAVTKLLSRMSSSTIQDLTVDLKFSTLFFRSESLPVLPALRRLTLRCTGGWISTKLLSSWLAQLHKLEQVSLYGARIFNSDGVVKYFDWKPVFDAVRSHRNGKLFETLGVWPPFRHHSKRKPDKNDEVRKLGHRHHRLANSIFMVKNYMSGYGEWDTSCCI